MTKFPQVTPLLILPGLWCFSLADNLTRSEKIRLVRNKESLMDLFRENFPDIYAWLCLISEHDVWYVDWRLGSVLQENWEVVLTIDDPRLAESFIQAWCEDVDK